MTRKTGIYMNAKHRTLGGGDKAYDELRSRLADVLTNRAQGLLTQKEYEESLEDIKRTLPQNGCLVERELPRGGTRFILREAGSGRILGEFEFRRGHEVET